MNCLIVAGGVKPKDEIINYYSEQCELIVGVDKGCNYLFEAKVKPNYIVGDFDSSNLEVINISINVRKTLLILKRLLN